MYLMTGLWLQSMTTLNTRLRLPQVLRAPPQAPRLLRLPRLVLQALPQVLQPALQVHLHQLAPQVRLQRLHLKEAIWLILRSELRALTKTLRM